MPEYNHGFTAPLKNAIDFLHNEWRYKPVGLVSYGGVSHPVWTDSRRQLDPIAGCSRDLGMEEVFSARIVIP